MHEEGSDRCRSNESYGHSLTELAVPACKSGEYNPPPSVPHMDGKRAAPRKGRRVVFAGIRFLCRAGPMCPAEKCVPGGGARGPRPTGQVRYPPVGDGVPTSHQRGSAALLGPLWEGAVGAADWGREKRGASLPPSALRADTSLSEGGAGRRIPTPVCTPRALASRRALARNDSASRCLGGRSRPPLRILTRGWRFRRNNKTTRRHAPAGRSYPVDNFS